VERAILRNGNVHSADGWRSVMEPVIERYSDDDIAKFFRGDAAFAQPEVYCYLESESYGYAILLPANDVLYKYVEHLVKRPVGQPPKKPVMRYCSFVYRAQSWDRPRRVIGKIEFHHGELFPRINFVVTNLSWSSKRVVRFYNKRGTAEQWIKEGKHAVNWTRLSCHDFTDNQVRLQLFVLAYSLGNFLRRLALPANVKHWTLTTLRDKLIKIGAKVVRHARYVTFQLAEVAVPGDLFRMILDRIGRFRSAPLALESG